MATEREQAKQQLAELRDLAGKVSTAEAKDGSWFTTFLFHVMNGYAKESSISALRTRYPGKQDAQIADARIERAKRWSAIAGGVSGAAYTGLIAATIGSWGSASPATLPGAAAAFLSETMFGAKLQLQLAYDMAVLCGHPIDLRDPDDVKDLLRAAFGMKAGQAFDEGLEDGAVKRTARRKVREATDDPAALSRKALPAVGRFLLKRNVVKFGIPFANIPISAAMNYISMSQVAQTARQIYSDKARANRSAAALVDDGADDTSLLLQVMVLVARADGDVEPEESWLLEEVCSAFESRQGAEAARQLRQAALSQQEPALLQAVSQLPPERRAAIYEAAVQAASADHVLRSGELAVLSRLAQACGVPFDEAALRDRAKQVTPVNGGNVPPAAPASG